MIKIKNKILIYFIFYINNVSFLTNKENEKTLTETQIQDYNNKERISDNNEEKKSENKFKDEKKILLLIPFGIVLLFILLFVILIIWIEYKEKQDKENNKRRIDKETQERKNLEKVLTRELIENNINNLDFFIFYNEYYIQINKNNENNQQFIADFNKFLDNSNIHYINFQIESSYSSFNFKFNNIQEKINDFKKINQKKPFVFCIMTDNQETNQSDISNFFNFNNKSISSFTFDDMVNKYNYNNNHFYFKISFQEDNNIKEIFKKYFELKTN